MRMIFYTDNCNWEFMTTEQLLGYLEEMVPWP